VFLDLRSIKQAKTDGACRHTQPTSRCLEDLRSQHEVKADAASVSPSSRRGCVSLTALLQDGAAHD
jgi:hypothetical protein